MRLERQDIREAVDKIDEGLNVFFIFDRLNVALTHLLTAYFVHVPRKAYFTVIIKLSDFSHKTLSSPILCNINVQPNILFRFLIDHMMIFLKSRAPE